MQPVLVVVADVYSDLLPGILDGEEAGSSDAACFYRAEEPLDFPITLWVAHRGEGVHQPCGTDELFEVFGDELGAEDLALSYKQLIRVEETWKTMKSTIEIRPVFHRTEQRIKAHVFLCVLALLMQRVAERACGLTWPKIHEELRSIKVAQLLAPQGTVYQTTSGSQEARNLLGKIKIKPLPEVLGVQ
jgi:hypothetical protein